MVTALFASFLMTLGWIIVHLFYVHIKPCSHRLIAMVKAFLGSLPFLFLFLFFLEHKPSLVLRLNGHENFLLAYGYAFLLQLLFFFFFVECFYHIERSVTLRLLIEIKNSSEKLTVEEIMKEYCVDEMIVRRLNDMQASGWLMKKNHLWALTPKATCLAQVMRFSCWLFQSQPQHERVK